MLLSNYTELSTASGHFYFQGSHQEKRKPTLGTVIFDCQLKSDKLVMPHMHTYEYTELYEL